MEIKTIRELREARGLTQFQLAVMAEVTPSTISNWERGATEPKVGQLRKLASILGVSMDLIEVADREEVAEGKRAA
jgi:transcriptional regulator with XRE-family HTH domain